MSAPVVPDWAYELAVADVSLTGAAKGIALAKDSSDEDARAALLRVALKNCDRLTLHLRTLLGETVAIAPAADVTHGSQAETVKPAPKKKAPKAGGKANA